MQQKSGIKVPGFLEIKQESIMLRVSQGGLVAAIVTCKDVTAREGPLCVTD